MSVFMSWCIVLLIPLVVSVVFNVIFMISLSHWLMNQEKREWQALTDSLNKIDKLVDVKKQQTSGLHESH